jgi:hypothetical protein
MATLFAYLFEMDAKNKNLNLVICDTFLDLNFSACEVQ